MTQIVSKLADLTALRDRQSLDTALVDTLDELVCPDSVAIHRLVGQTGNEHWLTCASKYAGAALPQTTQAYAEIDELPRAEEFAQRQQAVATRQPVLAGATGGINIFPLTAQAGSIAVMEIDTPEPLADELVRVVSGVMRLYQNFQGLLDYGERDALTELLNRKTFDGAFLKATTAQQQVEARTPDDRRDADASGNTRGSYWLAMLDIDHFKLVNDNFGHLIGDEVLLLLARLMRSTFRFHDQLYRFGGEEFVVLMRCNQGSQAQAALQRLRNDTEQHLFPQVGHITISIGFTEIRRGDSPSGAFERADKAVYYAKEHGRNQVCGFEDLIADGKLTAEPVNVGDVELF
jgi:diguanylate cyclase (GGDEF)-like protein